MARPDDSDRRPTAFSGGFADIGAPYWEGVRRMQSEYVAFMARRLEDDRQTLQALAACKDVSDVMDVQQRWAARCGDAYLREAPKLAAMAMESFNTGRGAPQR
ncbi:phasin family protein [Caulobacter sp. 17J80-11]|uniref:phasin family protein n=1 Tax=Caulobacter sp. 17J80-11 TaxID=2763502 RepID=UPI0016538E76|nr:phasin family protein [Caulobacter sp. 17J80-11]MBC6981321.1 phasin family protein [Caulobacter sp. 17J80-11]